MVTTAMGLSPCGTRVPNSWLCSANECWRPGIRATRPAPHRSGGDQDRVRLSACASRRGRAREFHFRRSAAPTVRQINRTREIERVHTCRSSDDSSTGGSYGLGSWTLTRLLGGMRPIRVLLIVLVFAAAMATAPPAYADDAWAWPVGR